MSSPPLQPVRIKEAAPSASSEERRSVDTKNPEQPEAEQKHEQNVDDFSDDGGETDVFVHQVQHDADENDCE
jgi:hypothetical protein